MSHFKGPDIEEAVADTSLITLLYESLSNDGALLVEGDSGKRLSFPDILQQTRSIAAGLQRAGVSAGDYVVLCCQKSIRAYSLLLAGMFTGATAVIVPTTHAGVIHQTTEGHEVKVVFCDAVYLTSVTRSVGNMTRPPSLLATTDPEDQTLASLMKSDQGFSLYQVPDVKKHIPLIIFTSGTTGLPKGVQMSDHSVTITIAGGLPGPLSIMVTSPFSWLSGVLIFIASVLKKYSFVMSNAIDPKQHLKIIEKYQCVLWFVMTGQMNLYVNEPSLHDVDVSSVKAVVTGGEPPLGTVIESFSTEVLGDDLPMMIIYASTEVGKIATVDVADVECNKGKVVSSGAVAAGVEVKILDDEGNLVEVGSLGQICVKSNTMTPGYWARPDLKDQLCDKEGFFPTGDAGYFDKLGRLYVTGRIGELIHYNGFKFPPSELEDLLFSHPAVLEAAVVGKPHSPDTNHATAYVVRIDKNSGITETDLQNFINGQVEDAKKLRGGVYFMETLPRTATGKVVRKTLLHKC